VSVEALSGTAMKLIRRRSQSVNATDLGIHRRGHGSEVQAAVG
jgi:hypothetical protein